MSEEDKTRAQRIACTSSDLRVMSLWGQTTDLGRPARGWDGFGTDARGTTSWAVLYKTLRPSSWVQRMLRYLPPWIRNNVGYIQSPGLVSPTGLEMACITASQSLVFLRQIILAKSFISRSSHNLWALPAERIIHYLLLPVQASDGERVLDSRPALRPNPTLLS